MIALIGITIERNVTSSRMKASESTNRNTIGRCDFIVSRKSFEEAVMPLTATSASSLATVAGTTSSQHPHRLVRRCVGALALDGEGHHGDRLVRADLDARGLRELPGGDRLV